MHMIKQGQERPELLERQDDGCACDKMSIGTILGYYYILIASFADVKDSFARG